MSNIERAEIDIIIGGKSYVMRPSFNALCEIEQSVGKSIITLLISFDQRGILLKEIIYIIKAGLKASGIKPPKDLEYCLYQQGYSNIIPVIYNFLKSGLNL
jgi:hypothetical protein